MKSILFKAESSFVKIFAADKTVFPSGERPFNFS
jgi:hypothetical protein